MTQPSGEADGKAGNADRADGAPGRFRPSRRDVLRWSGAAGLAAAFGGLRPFTAAAATPVTRPANPGTHQLVDTLWYPTPAVEAQIVQQGLPIGNGRLGALVAGDPENDFLYLTDGSMWLGDRNDSLGDDGQFSYDTTHFGTVNMLAHIRLNLPGHGISAITGYRRGLDLANGVVTTSYQHAGTQHSREVYASHPDDVVIIRLSAQGPERITGSVTVEGTHGETITGYPATVTAGLNSVLDNGLKYAAAVTAHGIGGSVTVSGTQVAFTGCAEVLIVASAGTNYSPAEADFFDPTVDPLTIATTRARTAARVPGAALLATHIADYRALSDTMTVNLGASTPAQRAMDTWSRLQARAAGGGTPDPELEASYLQFGRYLTITGSRDGLPLSLQGPWLETNSPAWMSDYHTDINLEMNYWLTDRAGLSGCFDALTDYCLSQLPYWTEVTNQLFLDERNGYRNTSGKVDGWAIAFSTNIYGGLGWWWHPAGNAWLCLSLWQHFEFTQDLDYLRRIYPLLKGAAQFWVARLITTTVTDPTTGASREVLVDDHDWSPEQGPQDAIGITYAQELVWMLFGHLQQASTLLNVDGAYATQLGELRAKLYLPVVSPTTGWLEEWMSPDNLGEDQHRHLSPLINFFPGDRINTDDSPAELIDGVRNLLIGRGMQSFGWADAWRALCWSRLRDADKAYQLVGEVITPSENFGNGIAPNFLDMYSLSSTSVAFQIDANFGTPTAMLDMVLYSRPGVIELLPALPSAWAAAGQVTGIGARGGFVVDVAWRAGKVTSARVRSVGGTATIVRSGSWSRTVRLAKGQSMTF
ncbi:MAG TPA: glycoside hydrolase N-terminal domain-containing protein [Pseudonocardiaceae bacterium]|jgi:alpha-L-fucosidase 2|nr:glycoside hydrolase N-terminal domain-containing protein [Pseudonocardiaceae bacterium]